MRKTLEQIQEIIDQYVGPNGAYVLITDDTSNVEVRTSGRESTILGLNQLGAQLVQDMTFAKIQQRLHGQDADLLKDKG
jgi:hypothetical protein